MIDIGIVGGSGYAAGELISLLLGHPQATINFIYSTSRAGQKVSSAHQALLGESQLRFSPEVNPDVDVLFLCTGHGVSSKVLRKHPLNAKTKVIDLSRDFRLSGHNTFEDRIFVYGLPELNGGLIAEASNIANPGCFATGIQLALLPLAETGALQNEVHIHGITGSTGAGSSLRDTTHFSWRSGNVSVYKAFEHQHIAEVQQSLRQMDPSSAPQLNFIPVRGNFTRGIFLSAYTNTELPLEEARTLYAGYYENAPFVHLSPEPIHLKQVVNTNKCLLHIQKKDGRLLLTAAIDNLLKGASGQALQNMNLMFGLEEMTGLKLKPSHY